MNLNKIFQSRLFPPAVLILCSLLSYGIFIPLLGLYSDDWIFLSVFQKYGHQGLTQYFQTNRPFFGLLFQLTMPILGKSVFLWHTYAMVASLACGFAFRWFILTLWPNKKFFALIGGILFILYPGFTLLPISITFGQIYFVYLFFLLSTVFMLKAAKTEKNRILYIVLSLFFSLANLFMMEYFICLAIIQPVLIWVFYRQNKWYLKEKICHLIKFYWPWMVEFLIVGIWRIFIFNFQTYNYGLKTIDVLKENLFSGILIILKSYFGDLFKTGIWAWFEPIKYILEQQSQTKVFYATIAVVLITFSLTFIGLLKFSKVQQEDSASDIRFPLKPVVIALLAMSFAGWPFWLTGLEVSLNGLSSRFTLPFIFGSCLLAASLIESVRKRSIKILIISLLISLAVGKSLMVMNKFRQESILVNSYMNQMIERIPGLKPGAFIISNDLPFSYFSDASFSFMVDWLYAPKAKGEQLDHVLVFSKDRAEDLAQSIFEFENVTFRFNSTIEKSISSVILFDYGVTPIGFNSCFTVLNQENLPYYADHITEQSNQFAPYSDVNNMFETVDPDTAALFTKFFPNKYSKPWCSNFQKVSVLHDQKEYQPIVAEYTEGAKPFYTPEILPYLDAFTQQQDWDKMDEILTSIGESSPDFVCTFLNDYSSKIDDAESNKQQYNQWIEQYQCKTILQ